MLQTQIVSVPFGGHGQAASQAQLDMEVLYCIPSDTTQQHNATVLFLPFWGGSASTFEEGMTELVTRRDDLPMFAVSYAGTGKTAVPHNDSAADVHSIMPRAEKLRSLLATELCEPLRRCEKLVICAHSMSAKITYALLSMLASDERFEVEHVALVLLGPAPVGPLVLPKEMREQQLKAYESVESARWTVENVLAHRKLGEEVLDRLAGDCVGMSAGAKEGWLQFGMGVDCAGYIKVVKERWAGLSVAVVVGEMDMVESVGRVQKQTVIPLREHGVEVTFKVAEGCGHLLPVEAAGEIVQAVLGAL